MIESVCSLVQADFFAWILCEQCWRDRLSPAHAADVTLLTACECFIRLIKYLGPLAGRSSGQ